MVERAPYPGLLVYPVKIILPLKAKQFTLPQARESCCHKQNLIALRSGTIEQFNKLVRL